MGTYFEFLSYFIWVYSIRHPIFSSNTDLNNKVKKFVHMVTRKNIKQMDESFNLRFDSIPSKDRIGN